MELRHLRLFAAVAKSRHLTRAAEMLGIDQPLASKHLHQLEDTVGGELFFRGKRPLKLTPLGEALAERVPPIIDSIDSLLDGLDTQIENRPVRFVGNSDIIGFKLPAVVQKYTESHPNSSIRIQERLRPAVVEAITNGDADVGILIEQGLPSNLEFIPLSELSPILVTRLGHPLSDLASPSLREIASHPLIFHSRFNQTPDLVKAAMQKERLPTNEVVELDNLQAVKRYVELGVGVSIISSFAIDPGDAGKFLASPVNFLPVLGTIGLVTLKGRDLPSNVVAFLNIAQEEMDNKFSQAYAFSLLDSGD